MRHFRRADLSAFLTVYVSTVGDTVNFRECIEKLRHQSVLFPIKIIDRIVPMSAAFQAMLDRCKTPYYVQVDKDMLLVPGAVAKLFTVIRSAPPRVALVCAPLWDVDTERSIYGVKIYRHRIVVRYPYADTFSCEMEQVHRLKKDGYTVRYLPLVEDGGKAFGERGKHYTPQTAFLRWKRTVQKHRRYGCGWDGSNRITSATWSDGAARTIRCISRRCWEWWRASWANCRRTRKATSA